MHVSFLASSIRRAIATMIANERLKSATPEQQKLLEQNYAE